jgi:uncharacterized protein (TIGR02284 family)
MQKMTIDNENVLKVTNDLIATCYDSQEGFGKAAKGCHSDQLRIFFTEIAAKRTQFAGELQREVLRIGGEPTTTGHWGGILHGGWVDLETRIRPKDDVEFLENCAKGEDGTRRHYARALADELPMETRTVIERQSEDVLGTLEQIRTLKGQPLER